MILWTIRIVFLLLVMSLMLLGFAEGGPFDFSSIINKVDTSENVRIWQAIAILGCAGILVIGFAIDVLLPRKRVVALAGLFFGVLVGLLIGMAFNYIVDLIYTAYNITENQALYVAKDGIKSMVTLLCCYLTVIFIFQTKDDFRFIIPYVEFSKQTKGEMPLILDTSVIIDGRIADIAGTKIFNSPMIIPRFILNELQKIADSADRLRRNRGRRGLDMLKKMQNNKDIDINIQEIDMTPAEKAEPVDHQLVTTGKKLEGRIVTNDFNLNKVANLRGVQVININDLANALKTVVLPGEMLQVKIVKPGDQQGQGVGYLDDGTMVVVDTGRHHLGQTRDVAVTSVLQTSAGKMIFGKINQNQGNSNSR